MLGNRQNKSPGVRGFCICIASKRENPRFKALPRDDSLIVVAVVLPCVVPEIGIEPTTYALRMQIS